MSKLNREQAAQLCEALIDSFGSRAELKTVLQQRLDLNLEEVSTGENLRIIVSDLVEYFQRRNSIETLLAAAAAERPSVPDFAALQTAAAQPGGSAQSPAGSLEEKPSPAQTWLWLGIAGAAIAVALLVWLLPRTFARSGDPSATATISPTAALALQPTLTATAAPSATATPRPPTMDGRFNVAVAEFGAVDAAGQVQPSEFGSYMSDRVYTALATEREQNPDLGSLGPGDLEIWRSGQGDTPPNVSIGLIADDKEAAQVAAQLHADMIIYGALHTEDDPNSLDLQFYYASPGLSSEPDAIVGRHRLGEPIAIRISYAQDPTLAKAAVDTPLQTRAQALAWLTTAMTLDLTGKQEQALAVLQNAEQALADWSPQDGKELLYFFLGRTALHLRQHGLAINYFQRAIDLDPAYANAYLGLGGVFFDRAQLYYLAQQVRNGQIPAGLQQCISQENLEETSPDAESALADINQAILYYEQAIAKAPDGVWPPIANVARLSLGLAYRLKGQAYAFVPDWPAAEEWLVKAGQTLASTVAPLEAEGLRQYVALAHLGQGVAYHSLSGIRFAQERPPGSATPDAEVGAQGVQLLQQAVKEYDACIDVAAQGPTDLVFQKDILDCGCKYYRGVAVEVLVSRGEPAP